MANIYLRLPSTICAFHRNRDVEHKLNPHDPWKTTKYTEYAYILRGCLYLQNGVPQKSAPCYSEQAWRNMLDGRPPGGGSVVLKRKSDVVYNSYEDVCFLEGRKLSDLSSSYDFLCIQIPKTVVVGDREMRTNPLWNLSAEGAFAMQRLFSNDFQRAIIDWELQTHDYCIRPGEILKRRQVDTLERFLMRYDIPVSHNKVERDSLRRQLNRWLADARQLYTQYRNFDITYEDPEDKLVTMPSSGSRLR